MKDIYSRKYLDAVHVRSSLHREEIEKSSMCGCFYCCEMFGSEEIEEWTDEKQTALCPKCGIDAVIGSSTFIINKELLAAMHKEWF